MDHLAAMILGPEEKEPEENEYHTVCAELLLAIDKKDPKLLDKALGAYFEMKDAEPHEEGEHLEEGE